MDHKNDVYVYNLYQDVGHYIAIVYTHKKAHCVVLNIQVKSLGGKKKSLVIYHHTRFRVQEQFML